MMSPGCGSIAPSAYSRDEAKECALLYAADGRNEHRLAKPGERLWTLTNGSTVKHAELRDGIELRIFHDGEIEYGRRYLARGFALEEADACRRDFERMGWTTS
jgi:hypothetical protein